MTDAGIIIVALIAAFGSVTAAGISGLALVQAQRTHHLINSRMDQLLAAAKVAARAEGVDAGRAESGES